MVLTRRVGEEIVIDGNIRVVIVALQRDKIRLGIDAPPTVTVDRKEIHDRRAGPKVKGNVHDSTQPQDHHPRPH